MSSSRVGRNEHAGSMEGKGSKLTDGDLFKSYKTPWKSEIEHWSLTPGSEHEVYLFRCDNFLAPYSKLRVGICGPDLEVKYDQLRMELNRNGMNSDAKVGEKLVYGTFVLICLGEEMYRARVLNKVSSKKWKSYAFDTAKYHIVHEMDMYWPQKQHMELRPRAVEVYLEGLTSFQESLDLKRIVGLKFNWDPNITLTMSVTSQVLSGHAVVSFRDRECLNYNNDIVKEIWSLYPEVNPTEQQSVHMMNGRVVHAKPNGIVAVQFPSNWYFEAFKNYMLEAEKQMPALIQKEKDPRRVKKKNLDYRVTYLAYTKVSPSATRKVLTRLRLQHTKTTLNAKKNPDPDGNLQVDCTLVDYGNQERIVTKKELIRASDAYPWLDLVPPMAVIARLCNVKKLKDPRNFLLKEKYVNAELLSFIRHPETDEVLVDLYYPVECGSDRNSEHKALSVSKALIEGNEAVPFEVPFIGIPKPPMMPTAQIFMNNFADFFNTFSNDTRVEILQTELFVHFRVVNEVGDQFIVETFDAEAIRTMFHQKLHEYTSAAWVKAVSAKQFENGFLYKGCCYAFFSEAKNEILRVKLSESVPYGFLEGVERSVLCVDYGEYYPVLLSALMPIPREIVMRGPQAARVEKAGLELTIGDTYSALVKDFSEDEMGMTILKLEDCKLCV